MHDIALPFMLIALALRPAPDPAFDPSQIPRTIAREPVYRSKAPRYHLLVLGPEAKTRIWIVLDGDVLYVDRNANGDLTEEGERFTTKSVDPNHLVFQLEEFGDREGTVTFPKAALVVCRTAEEKRPALNPFIMHVTGRYRQVARGGPLAERPQEAPITHVDGPLTMGLHLKPTIVPGNEFTVNAWIGTPAPGHERGSFIDFMPYDTMGLPGVPRGIHPTATIEFPPRDPKDRPIEVQVRLASRH